MSRRTLLAILLTLAMPLSEASAQVFVPPGFGVPVFVPHGIGLRYRSRNLSIGGFWQTGYSVGTFVPGFGVVVNPYAPAFLPVQAVGNYNISYNVITPQIVLADGPVPPLTQRYDLSGVDLDVEPPPNEKDFQPRRLARPAAKPQPRMAPEAPPPAAAKVEVAKIEVPGAARGVDVLDLPDIPRVDLPPPRLVLDEEYDRLLELGLASFRQGNFGVAARRFEQARDVLPNGARALFFLGQSYVALGKYQQAADVIVHGLRLQPDWPLSAFQPRLDFYRGLEEEWQTHLRLLENAAAHEPHRFAPQFLLGYHQWFTGDRVGALALLERARLLAVDPAPLDAFPRAAK